MLSFLIGLAVGVLIFYLYTLNPWTTTGKLKIDNSNPNKDLYRFEIDDIDSLDKKKRIIVKIVHNADLSQK